MSVFIPGNSVLKSINLPAAAFEVFGLLQEAEKANANAPNNTQITLDSNAGVATATLNLPVTRTVNANGQVIEVASDYLGGDAFVPGTSQLKSTHLPAVALEIVQTLVNAENTANVSRTGLDIDANAGIGTLALSIPYTETIVNGNLTIVPTDYLV